MKNKARSIHLFICITAWILWAVGIVLLAVVRFGNPENSNRFFFDVVHPYNVVMLMGSLLPIEPIACAAAIIKDHEAKAGAGAILMSLLLFVVTAILWIGYISLFVMWTGGV